MAFHTYILRSDKTGRYYIGQTNDVNARLKRHNSGLEKSTKPYAPWILLGFKTFDSRAEAIKLERQLKGMKSRKRLESWMNDEFG